MDDALDFGIFHNECYRFEINHERQQKIYKKNEHNAMDPSECTKKNRIGELETGCKFSFGLGIFGQWKNISEKYIDDTSVQTEVRKDYKKSKRLGDQAACLK